MRYAIVGGSAAGLSALRAVRAHDPSGKVVLISGEKEFYYRPLIPYVVEGSRAAEDIALVEETADFHGVEVVFERAASLDAAKKEISLESGRKVGFDRLLIATGGAALVPGVPGIGRAFTLRTLDDARRLGEASRGAGSAVVMGGGFVGLKAAAALKKIGMKVAVVEKLGQVLYPRLDGKGAEILSRRLSRAGIDILTGETVAEVLPREVRLGSGVVLKADVVVAAVGVRPGTEWLGGSGLGVERAVVVDEMLMTSAEGIYAAGDVAQGRELVGGAPAVSALWTNAFEMGRAAGANMAGGKVKYPGFLGVMNATEFEGLPVVSVGDVAGEGEVFASSGGEGYRKLVFRGGRLVGAIFMGDIRRAGIYTNLIKNAVPVGKFKDRAVDGSLSFADFLPAA